MNEPDVQEPDRGPIMWATGAVGFAAIILALAGAFHIAMGIAAIRDSDFFTLTSDFAFKWDITGWGWFHIIYGAILLVTGGALMTRAPWAALTGILVAGFSALSAFFFLPYYPLWGIVLIAADLWVIWALARPGAVDL